MYESIVFCSAFKMSSVRKFMFAISSPDEFLVILVIINSSIICVIYDIISYAGT